MKKFLVTALLILTSIATVQAEKKFDNKLAEKLSGKYEKFTILMKHDPKENMGALFVPFKGQFHGMAMRCSVMEGHLVVKIQNPKSKSGYGFDLVQMFEVLPDKSLRCDIKTLPWYGINKKLKE